MATPMAASCVFQASHVAVDFKNSKLSSATVKLYPTQVQFLQDGSTAMTIPLSQMSSIDIHQPFFGANYIVGEYNEIQGGRNTFTMTFNKGGATEFARTFFQVAGGEMVTMEDTSSLTQEAPSQMENKKNV